jgi:hypothetical protein
MSNRPPTLIGASALLLVIGISGLFAAAGLIAVAPRADEIAPGMAADVARGGIAVGLIMGAYALAAVIAGFALMARRRAAWWLGVATIALGLGLLALSLVVIQTLEPVLMGGVVIWGVALVLLLAPATRRSVKS